MNGKKLLAVGLIMAVVALTPQSLLAVIIVDLAYQVETYVTYTRPDLNPPNGMTFDSSGNLYITHKNNGRIYKIDSNRNDSLFVTGLNTPEKIVWGGGTPYGDNLYTTEVYGDKVTKITSDGIKSFFCSPDSQVLGIGIDRVGRYGGYMYTGTALNDHIDKVTSAGVVQKFSDFPYGMSGNVQGFDFDPGLDYGGLMYSATYSSTNRTWSGVFSLDADGNPTRFAPDIINGTGLAFDTVGLFNNELIVRGRRNSDVYSCIYRADPSGQITPLANGFYGHIFSMTFGPDGALYVSEYNNNTVIISRIIPEPASLALLALSAVRLLRRRKSTC